MPLNKELLMIMDLPFVESYTPLAGMNAAPPPDPVALCGSCGCSCGCNCAGDEAAAYRNSAVSASSTLSG